MQALREAEARFDLTDKEKDIIVKHMWPLSPWMPRYKESFTVSMMDKYCAMMSASSWAAEAPPPGAGAAGHVK